MSENSPKPPQHLSKDAKAWWRKLNEEYDLSDSASQMLLESALSAFDRWQGARKILDREGPIIKDRFGQRQVHPAAGVERDSKATMVRALRELHLDLEPLRDAPGRPPGRK